MNNVEKKSNGLLSNIAGMFTPKKNNAGNSLTAMPEMKNAAQMGGRKGKKSRRVMKKKSRVVKKSRKVTKARKTHRKH